MNAIPPSSPVKHAAMPMKARQESQAARFSDTSKAYLLSVGGILAIWCSLPPVGCWPLAYIAIAPWTLLLRMPELSVRKHWRLYYLTGLGYWLLQTQWVRLPHWSAWFGWIVLSMWLAVYVLAFFAIARSLIHARLVPAAIAVPATWIGLEWVRGFLFTGFALAALGHSQVHCWPILQLADLGGAYAVGFLLTLVGASVAAAIPLGGQATWKWLPVAACAWALSFAYGTWRLNEGMQRGETEGASSNGRAARPLAVAIIQGKLDTVFDDSDAYIEEINECFRYHLTASIETANKQPRLDVILWPENMFNPWAPVGYDDPIPLPAEIPADRVDATRLHFLKRCEEIERNRRNFMESLNEPRTAEGTRRGTSLVVGSDYHFLGHAGQLHYNSALLIDAQGEIVDRYDKMHPVMFGEYVPLGDVFPWLYSLTPMSGGLTPGAAPRSFRAGAYRLSPCICFESTVPHLVRRQLLELEANGEPIDMLVNLTNDGWFWGSSLLDLHLACNQFRAVESRKPLLVAANTGVSAVIDGCGRLEQRGRKRENAVLVAEVLPDGRWSPYSRWGDWPACVCLALSLTLAIWPRGNTAKPS